MVPGIASLLMASLSKGSAGPLSLSVPAIFWYPPTGINGGTLVDGAEITSWADSGPNNYAPVAIGGAGNRLTVKTSALNGYAAARGSGAHHGLQLGSSSSFTLTSTSTYTVFAVVMWSASQSQNGFWGMPYDHSGHYNGLGIYSGSSPPDQLWHFDDGVNMASTFVPSFSTYYYIICVVNAGVVTLYVSGTSYTTSGTFTAMSAGASGFTLGDFANASVPFNNYMKGDLVDIAMYDAALSSSDRTILNTYAQSTYGL